MSIKRKLTDAITFPLAAALVRRNPVLKAAILQSSSIWSSAKLDRLFSEETKNALAGELMARLQGIVQDRTPVVKCREAFCDAVIELANYQVLALPPAPEPDTIGLRGTQGVTGELKSNLLEIAEKNRNLREVVYGAFPGTPTYEEIWNAVAGLFWRSYWWAETINAARRALGDCNNVEERDWHKPFLHAMCVSAEDTYRKDVGMPSAIPDPRGFGLVPLMYSTFLQMVLSGDRFPDLSWREHYKDQIERGDLRPPFPADQG